MPVVAVGMAIALDTAAIGAAMASSLTVLSAITAIGATVSAVGAVTHNKTLSLIGAGIGIVGAVGSLAYGTDALGNVKDLFGTSSAGAASTADEAALQFAGGAADLPAQAADITTATGGVSEGATNAAKGLMNSTAAAEGDAAAIAAKPGTALAGAISPGASTADEAAIAASGTGAAKAATTANQMAKIFSTADEAALAYGNTAKTASNLGSVSGLLSWANKNPTLAFGMIQAGGSFISGLTDPMTPAQIDALNAQADVNRATADLIKRQAANQGRPLPVASAPVTGKVAPAGSLINSTPVSSALITGAPNSGAPTPAQLVTGKV